MKFNPCSLFLMVIFFSIPAILTSQVLQLDVEGDTRIRGNLDLSPQEDNLSVIIGYDAATNADYENSLYNTAVGGWALHDNTSGAFNTICGSSSGYSNTTGFRNTFIGRSAAYENKTGSFNVALGYSAGRGDTSMTNSVYIGNEAGFYSLMPRTQRSGNIFIGNKAGKNVPQSNRLYIHNSDADSSEALIFGRFDSSQLCFNADVGLGVNRPQSRLDVSANSGGNYSQILLRETDINDFARLRFKNGQADQNFWDIAARPKANGDQANAVLNFFYNDALLNVLQLQGDGNAILAGDLTENSDKRLKMDIVPIDKVLSALMQLHAYHYRWKRNPESGIQTGFLAQEVQNYFPEMVREDDHGILSVNYSKFVPLLLVGMKELSNENEELKTRVQMLEKEFQKLKSMIIDIGASN